jgi:hypothetical protein
MFSWVEKAFCISVMSDAYVPIPNTLPASIEVKFEQVSIIRVFCNIKLYARTGLQRRFVLTHSPVTSLSPSRPLPFARVTCMQEK